MISRIKNMFFKDRTGRSGMINLALKPVSLVISLIYTPILLSYLGDERYGLWATLLSIINWVNYFDVGIGNGLRNLLSKEIADKKELDAQKSVSTAYIILSGISSILLILLLVSVAFVNWNGIFSTEIDMRAPVAISFTLIIINFVLSLINTLLYALQKSERIAICNCIAQLINLFGLIALKQFTTSSLIAISILFGASSMIVHVTNSLTLYRKYGFLRPKFKYFSKEKIASICSVGMKFFVIQIMSIFIFTVDNLLISHFIGPESVTPFSITHKVFNTAYSVFAAFMVPFWSRATVAFKNHDIPWLKSSIRKTGLMCAVFIAGYILLAVLFKPIVSVWLGKDLNYEPGLILVMCAFFCLFSLLCVECQFINGSGKINVQLISYVVIGIANIPLSIFMGVHMNMGTVGVRLATTILIFFEVIILGFNLLSIIIKSKKESEQLT